MANTLAPKFDNPMDEIKWLREQNALLTAPKAPRVYVDPKGSGRIVITGCGRAGRTFLTPKAVQVICSHAKEILACAAAHPELEAAYEKFAATFADKD